MNNHRNQMTALLVATAGILTLAVHPVFAAEDGWTKADTGWNYYENGKVLKNTRVKIDGNVYAFDNNGKMVTGLYTGSDGSLTCHTSSGEAIRNKWKKIDGVWYYFDEPEACRNGVYLIGGTGYAFDQYGRMLTGWVKNSMGTWCYFRSDGSMVRQGWLKLNGSYYYFMDPGIMQTGWVQDRGKIYYLQSDGVMARGNLILDGMEFIFDSYGALSSSKSHVDTADFLTRAEYDKKAGEFIKIPRYANGAPWSHDNKSELTAYPIGACDGYAYEFIKYVFNHDMTTARQVNSHADVQFYSASDLKSASAIRAGDMIGLEFDIYGQHCGHVIIVLQRNGDQLITAEGNMDGKVVVSDSWYYIQNNQLMRRSSTNLKIDKGIHFLHS